MDSLTVLTKAALQIRFTDPSIINMKINIGQCREWYSSHAGVWGREEIQEKGKVGGGGGVIYLI